MFAKKKGLFFLKSFILFLILFLCTSSSNEKKINSSWRTDLQLAKSTLLNQEAGLLSSREKSQNFSSSMDILLDDLGKYNNDDEIEVELSRAIATIGQSHTQLQIKAQKMLPFKLYIEDHKIFVIATLRDYQETLFAELIKVEQTESQVLIKELIPSISHENEQSLENLLPDYIIAPSYLHGLKVIPNTDSIQLTFRLTDGSEKTLSIPTVELTPTLLKKFIVPYRKNLYFQLSKKNYEYRYLSENKALYLAYNVCEESLDYPIDMLKEDVTKVLQNNRNSRLIIDLRANSGGDSHIISPILEDKQIQAAVKGRTLVLIGRGTASSAILNAIEAKDQLNAILIGEPTGGNPNMPGETKSIILPGTKHLLDYTSEMRPSLVSIRDALIPDIRVGYTIQDYKNGVDPVLESALLFNGLSD